MCLCVKKNKYCVLKNKYTTMSYKLLCSDIDGTLLDKNRELSERTINVIQKIKENKTVVLISSRMPKAMRHLQYELEISKHPLIAYNGGLILTYEEEEAKTLLSIEISIDITEVILEFTQKTSVHMSLYHADEWFVPAMDYWANREMNNTKVKPDVADLKVVCENWKTKNIGPHKIMCMGEAAEIQLLEDYLKMHHNDDLNIYRSKDTYLEIASKKISKLSALSILLDKKFEIDLVDVIAFGDNYNDIELLKGVGIGVAVDNAREEVKAVADKITLSNKEDGVAVVLEEMN